MLTHKVKLLGYTIGGNQVVIGSGGMREGVWLCCTAYQLAVS